MIGTKNKWPRSKERGSRRPLQPHALGLRSGARWAPLVLVAVGLLVAGATSGHVIKPHFDQVWERIRYHDTFHDGHGHDGYGHGFHMGNSGHIHDENGMATRPPWPPEVIHFAPGPADPPRPGPIQHPASPLVGPRPGAPSYNPTTALNLDVVVVNDVNLNGLPENVELLELLGGPPDPLGEMPEQGGRGPHVILRPSAEGRFPDVHWWHARMTGRG